VPNGIKKEECKNLQNRWNNREILVSFVRVMRNAGERSEPKWSMTRIKISLTIHTFYYD
jgi:hypothetical protein